MTVPVSATALRRAAMTVSMLGVATAAGAAMVFLTQALLARLMGPNAYGLFASSLATVTMIAPLAGFGLTQFHLKVYGVEGWDAQRWLKPSLDFLSFTTLLAVAAVVAWALTGAPRDDTRFSLLALAPVILSFVTVNLVSNKLRLEDRFGRMALNQMAIPASRLLVAIGLLLVPHLTGRFVALSYGIISLLMALAAIPQLRDLFGGRIALKGHGPRTGPAARSAGPGIGAVWSEAWAYGVYAALYPVFFQISTILLKYLSNDTHAGLYAIALAVMTAIYLIPATIYQKFLQGKLHRWAAHDKPKFRHVYRMGNIGMFAAGSAIAAAMALLSPWLVPLIFGEEYRRVTAILTVLAICVPIRFLSTSMGSALLTEDNMRFRVYAMALATLAAIAGNVVLIPLYDVMGAAWATVAAETVLLLGTLYGVRRFTAVRREDADSGGASA